MSQPGERTVIVEEPPPAPAPGTPARVLLARMLRIVDVGPRPFFQAALVSLAVTAGLAIMIALQVRPVGPLPRPQRDIITIGLVALGVVGVLTLATVLVPARIRAAVVDRLAAPQQRAAIWLALTVWFPLVDVIAYYRGESTLPSTQVWIAFGYQDKRWLVAAYLIGALAPMVLLVGAARVLEAGRTHPASWGSWLRELAPYRRPGTAVASTGPLGRWSLAQQSQTRGPLAQQSRAQQSEARGLRAMRPRALWPRAPWPRAQWPRAQWPAVRQSQARGRETQRRATLTWARSRPLPTRPLAPRPLLR